MHNISRIVVLLLTASLVACGGTAPPTTSSTGGPLTAAQLKGRSMVIEGWGGVWTQTTQKYFGDPFAQQFGVTIQYPSAPNPGTAVHLQVQSGSVQSDICDTCSYSNYKQGDLATFPDWLQTNAKQYVAASNVSDHNIGGYGDTATLIACNPDIIKKCPTNAKEFWDVKNFPGPRAISGAQPPDAALLFALMADGVPKNKLYPMDIPRAIKKLKEIKPSINAWPTSGGQMQQLLIDKEVGIEYGWNGRMFVVQRDNIPNLKLFWDDSVVGGGIAGGLSVVKGAPNADVAFTFINWWVQQADLQAKWTSTLTYPTPNKNVGKLLAPNIQAGVPYSPTHAAPTQTDAVYTYDHQNEEKQAWQQFLTGT